jgi:hypothetical protein
MKHPSDFEKLPLRKMIPVSMEVGGFKLPAMIECFRVKTFGGL